MPRQTGKIARARRWSALIAGNRDKLATNELAATNAVRTGYLNPGRTSTW